MSLFMADGTPIEVGVNELYGKRIMQIGDSNTNGGISGGGNEPSVGYHYALSKKYGYTYINNGDNGASWELRDNDYDAKSGVTKVDALLASGELPDILLIALGTNGSSNGEATDTRDNTHTIYGAVRYCLYELKTKAPTLRVGVILPPNRGTTCGVIDEGQASRNEIIRSVCREYAVPCCDMLYESGITPDMLSDGLHLQNADIIVERMPLPRWLYMRRLESFLLTL